MSIYCRTVSRFTNEIQIITLITCDKYFNVIAMAQLRRHFGVQDWRVSMLIQHSITLTAISIACAIIP